MVGHLPLATCGVQHGPSKSALTDWLLVKRRQDHSKLDCTAG